MLTSLSVVGKGSKFNIAYIVFHVNMHPSLAKAGHDVCSSSSVDYFILKDVQCR